MKLRLTDGEKNIILNKNTSFKTDAGWDESFQTYEDEVLREIINPIENYETNRYIHKPYISPNNINQTDIWFYFYFIDSNGTYDKGLDYYNQGLKQNDKLMEDLKNSFFRLEFYKVPESEDPNRSNRRLVFAKNLSLPLGERTFIESLSKEIYVPVFHGSNYKNKENMYLFWFQDDTVLEETYLTGGTFYMTAKFYNSADGSKTQFTNRPIGLTKDLVEETDLYYKVSMDRNGNPTYNYEVFEYSGTTGSRRGMVNNPIKFYEMGDTNITTP
jgi:hypothetical protein